MSSDSRRVSAGEYLDAVFDGLSDNQAIQKVVVLLRTFTPDMRLAVFNEFCKECGASDPRCQCWNDD